MVDITVDITEEKLSIKYILEPFKSKRWKFW